MGGYWFLKSLYGIRSYDITLKQEPSRVRTSQDWRTLACLVHHFCWTEELAVTLRRCSLAWLEHLDTSLSSLGTDERKSRESWGKISAEATRQMCRFQSPSQIWLQLPRPACSPLEGDKCHCYSGRWNLVLSCPGVSTVAVTLFQRKGRNCWSKMIQSLPC